VDAAQWASTDHVAQAVIAAGFQQRLVVRELWVAGDRVLRFPSWAIRHRPAEVVAQVRAALLAAGWRPPR
jgi:hypothetical protein